MRINNGFSNYCGRLAAAFLFYLIAANVLGQSDTRLAATWQVTKYDIAVTIPASEQVRDIQSRATLELRNVSGRAANSITLRISPNATVTAAMLNSNKADFSLAEEKIGSINLQRISLRPPSIPAGGAITVVVEYKLSVRENSGLSGLSAAGSQFLPMSFWYPTPNSWYFARGADYAPTRVRIEQSTGQKIISSGSSVNGAYEQKLNVQPFFVVGNWEQVDHSGVAIHIPSGGSDSARSVAAEMGKLANEAKAYFAELLGTAPSSDIRIVATTRGAGFSSGGTILVERSAFSRPKLDSLTATSISEAIARLWIGEALIVSGDGYGIIREGLTRHLANKFLEKKYGKSIADTERARQRFAYSSVSRRDGPLMQVAPLDDFYFTAVANKGSMFWRIIEQRIGSANFYEKIKANSTSGTLTMSELRAAFAEQKDLIDPMLDQQTEMNLLAGLPQVMNGETKVALRNTGAFDVSVSILAHMENGQTLSAPATIRAKSFGEVNFRAPSKITRVEIDAEKLYPQTDFSDDIAPRETTDSDLLLAVKRDFDRQAYAEAEKTARMILRWWPHYDDIRALLGRSLLALGRPTDAEKEFRAILAEPLPSSRSFEWALVGLADIASKTGKTAEAATLVERTIQSEAEYGAALLARNIRNRTGRTTAIDETIKAFFAQFDRAAISNRKAEVEALVMPGEITRFAGGIAGNAVEWKSELRHVDMLDSNTALVETNMSIRLLNRETETGMAVYRLFKTGSGWRIAAVEIFEVR